MHAPPSPPPPTPRSATLSVGSPAPETDPGGGSWEVVARAPNGTLSYITLLFAAPDTNVSEVIKNLTSWTLPVTVTRFMAREGPYLAAIWNVTWSGYAGNSTPAVFAAASRANLTPAGVVLATETRAASPNVKGSVRLSLGSACESVAISFSDSATTVSSALASLPGLMAPPLRVEKLAGDAYSTGWRVWFDPQLTPGNIAPLRLAADPLASLEGSYPKATLATEADGSTATSWSPIPADLTALAVSAPGSISLDVNGVPSACAHPSGLCTFMYTAAATPSITSASPLRLGVDGTDEHSTLTISGQGLLYGTTVALRPVGSSGSSSGSGIDCPVTGRVGSVQLTCRVPDAAATSPAGSYQLLVNVPGMGDAAGAPLIALDLLRVAAASPTTLATGGWTQVTLTGTGIDPSLCSSYRVLIGGGSTPVQCAVTACTHTSLQALFPGGDATAAAPLRVQLLAPAVGGSPAALITEHAPGNITFSIAATGPRIASIDSPAFMLSSSAGDIAITLAGGLMPAQVSAVSLVPAFAGSGGSGAGSNNSAAAAALAARIGCGNVASVGPQQLTCSVGSAVPIGSYYLAVEAPASQAAPGVAASPPFMALSSATVQFDFAVMSVSPTQGSVGGGTLLTITGSGFPAPGAVGGSSGTASPTTSVGVYIRVPASGTFPDGLLACDVVTTTATQITCRTRPHLAAPSTIDDPMGSNIRPMATAAAPVQLLVCGPAAGNGTGAPLQRGPCAGSTRWVAARCGAGDTTLCNFQYVDG